MDEAVAAIAAHLGVIDEDQINNMSIPFFNSVLSALGRRLNYESVSNLYGNSFCKDSSKYVQEAYPLVRKSKINKAFAGILGAATIIKNDSSSHGSAEKMKADLNDASWAEGLF